jgi:peptide/nickel transport system substrate-binding protein/oligopeptide transport system substrate-binding protein
MKHKFTSHLVLLVVLIMIASTVLSGCGSQPAEQSAEPPATEPPATQAVEKVTEKATEPPAAEVKLINSAGVELPADAAPLDQQVFRVRGGTEQPWLTTDSSMYATNPGAFFAWGDACTRLDRDFLPQPAGCESWELSDDGFTWTFHLPEDKVWSDGTPVTAQDWVLAMQRYARPGYDFGWFFGFANIENWNEVTQEEMPPEELGVKAVDDYTFAITTTRPTPYMDKLLSWLFAVPSHVVEDWMDDDWAFRTSISSNAYILDNWEKGVGMTFVANDKYTGPYPPMAEKIESPFMNLDTFWLAYQEGEIDWVNAAQKSTIDQIMADPELQKQVISYPFFETDYLFFDTWNPPFDNLKVRQAFAHAVDRETITNGPLAHMGSPAFTMNPAGFPGENAEAIKDENNYDPELAAKLMAEAGYPDGEGFPKVSLYLRRPEPVVVTTAEAIASMLKKNLGVDVEIQNVERRQFQDMMGIQKREKEGDFQLALVSYMYDFVDGSNFLSVWGGCEPEGETDLSNMPGRHTWYNKEYNDLICEAGSIMGDEDKRNELYAQAESILIKDAALVPVWHPIKNWVVRSTVQGPLFEPDSKGVVRFEFENNLDQLYVSTEEREPVNQ